MSQVNSCYRNISFETAIKNVGLFADNVWTIDNSDKEFLQKNQDLWIRFNEVEELGRETNYSSKYMNNLETVKERIPHSRLATYGNFTYSKSEDLFYSSCDPYDNADIYKSTTSSDESEFWMHSSVEKEYRRLTSPIPTRSCLQQQDKQPAKCVKQEGYIQPLQASLAEPPSHWLQNQPWPTYLLYYHPNLVETLSHSSNSLFNEDPEEHKRVAAIIKHPPLRYSLSTPNEYELHMKLNAAPVKELWDLFFPYLGSSISDLLNNASESQVALPIITFNCEVPEFYPKTVLQRNWHMLPSASDPNYQVDLFPYQAPICSHLASVALALPQPQSQTLRLPPPPSRMSSIQNLPTSTLNPACSIPSWSKTTVTVTPQPIPVFQRPPEFYAQTDNAKLHRRRGGVEFSNLILLAKNSDNENESSNDSNTQMTEVLQTNGHKQPYVEQTTFSEMITPIHTQQFQHNQQMVEMELDKATLEQINLWLNKVYPQRSEHFSEMMNAVETMYSIALEVDKYDTNFEPANTDQPVQVNRCNDNLDNNQVNAGNLKNISSPNSSNSTSPQRQRRLYRDVLSGDAENKYAQLEQEALEQYQASSPNIQAVPSEETLAQRYQDLEREAVEQYRGDRDDWFMTPLTGEAKGGAGHIEDDPDPPVTIISQVSNGIHQHQEIIIHHQVGIDEVDAAEEENQKKEDLRETKYKKESIQIKDVPNISFNNFVVWLNNFHTMMLDCNTKKKLKMYQQRKQLKQVLHQLNKFNNLIANSNSLMEFKLLIDLMNIYTYDNVIVSCLRMCCETNCYEYNCLQERIQRTVELRTFALLFMPFLTTNWTKRLIEIEDYKSKYIKIQSNNRLGHIYDYQNIIYPFEDELNTKQKDIKLCYNCLFNQILSKLVWSCLLSFDKISTDWTISCKKKRNVYVKNTSLYTMIYNNKNESTLNSYYERYCKNILKSIDWHSIGRWIADDCDSYLINENIYYGIRDWSWIYYLKCKNETNPIIIDSVIDRAAIIDFDKTFKIYKDMSIPIYRINWHNNVLCFKCQDTATVKCCNEANVLNLSRGKMLEHNYIKMTCTTNDRSLHSRSQRNSLKNTPLNTV